MTCYYSFTREYRYDKIIFLHHAGGISNIYNLWKDYLSRDILMIPVDMTGHGKRQTDNKQFLVEEYANDLFEQILPHIELTAFYK